MRKINPIFRVLEELMKEFTERDFPLGGGTEIRITKAPDKFCIERTSGNALPKKIQLFRKTGDVKFEGLKRAPRDLLGSREHLYCDRFLRLLAMALQYGGPGSVVTSPRPRYQRG